MKITEFVDVNPRSLIAKAYKFAEQAHRGQYRQSGEPYFNHSLQTAETLLAWRLDETTVAAGLLHDTVEDTKISNDEIAKQFGKEVAFLVEGVTKLGYIKYRGAESKIENLRKMVLAVSEDLRVVFIKLADRLHNMRTLEALPRDKQKRIAAETDEIYAPLAYRLGMFSISGELEDLAFPYLYPQEDKWLKSAVADEYTERFKYLETVRPALVQVLKDNNIQTSRVDFRAKRWSSLYKKLLRKEMDISKVYDLVAMRVIINTVEECYAALGTIHQLWPPLTGRFKDYIALPKPNGYRSLHTTVIGPEGKFIEIQIRTQAMHEEDELGIAAHWVYEQMKTNSNKSKQKSEEINWVKQLRNWLTRAEHGQADSEEFLQSMKIDFFKDRIFAITPKGDVIDLPRGATPVDFAYQVHTEVGNSCVGAKVNDHFTPLNHELRSGDVVQVLTQKNKRPSEDWLKFVKTSMAREHIRVALKHKERALDDRRTPTKAELRIAIQDRVGLLKDITAVIARSHVNILNLQVVNPGSKFPIDRIECATTDKAKIEKLILKLKQIKEVKEISYKLI